MLTYRDMYTSAALEWTILRPLSSPEALGSLIELTLCRPGVVRRKFATALGSCGMSLCASSSAMPLDGFMLNCTQEVGIAIN